MTWRNSIKQQQKDQKSQLLNMPPNPAVLKLSTILWKINDVITYDVIVRLNDRRPPFFQTIVYQLTKNFKKLSMGTYLCDSP